MVSRADQFEQLAILDGMSGLYNRRHLEAVSEIECARFQRYQRPLSLVLIDIDHFKQINDHQGHEAADGALLGLLGCVVRASARRTWQRALVAMSLPFCCLRAAYNKRA
jgi:diguanylate cyclase (GGDEF)-like protein